MKKGNIRTPSDVPGPRDAKSKGPGVWNGEPGLQGRTKSRDQLPEKTYDQPPGSQK